MVEQPNQRGVPGGGPVFPSFLLRLALVLPPKCAAQRTARCGGTMTRGMVSKTNTTSQQSTKHAPRTVVQVGWEVHRRGNTYQLTARLFDQPSSPNIFSFSFLLFFMSKFAYHRLWATVPGWVGEQGIPPHIPEYPPTPLDGPIPVPRHHGPRGKGHEYAGLCTTCLMLICHM